MIRASRVLLGMERLIDRGPGSLPARLGLLTNQSTIMPDGQGVLQALLKAGFPIVRIFGPEHGFSADAQDTVEVEDSEIRGLEVVSLYGARRRPEHRHLKDLDAIIIDIQDIGCRYYTYLYTVAAVIEECSIVGIEVIICARPNPLGAVSVEGGALPRGTESEVGGYGMAVRHGLTLGEFALFLDGDLARSYNPYHKEGHSTGKPAPKASSSIVWMDNYRRDMPFARTGLLWKPPSPNIPSPETAHVYPGTCLFEGTNISEGRGSTSPFQVIGAPWLDPESLREALGDLGLPGTAFSAADYVPTFSAFAGERCRGVQIHVTDRSCFPALRVGVEVLLAVRKQDPESFAWRPLWEDSRRSFIDSLAGGPDFRRCIDGGGSAAEAYGILCRESRLYLEAREEALHYGKESDSDQS